MKPAFNTCGGDLWGLVEIKDNVIKRGKVTKLVYRVLLMCTATRATNLDVACGASTEELMHMIRCALTRYSDIKTIICDLGSNLIGASNLLAEWMKGWDQEKLTELSAKKGMEFHFVISITTGLVRGSSSSRSWY